MSNTDEIHIPEGINYDCQGCGVCCSGWSVNMDEEDYKRVSSVDWGELRSEYKGRKMFRELKPHEKAGTAYTHRIVSSDDTCPFLVDKLCFIHGQKGGTFKPTICQQFPYAFTETPSGVYATVSFVSMAVLYNQGTPLLEQRDTINKKFSEFKRLHPEYKADWSKIQLSVEQPLSWEQYMQHESVLLGLLAEKSKSLKERLSACCDYLAAEMAKTPRGASTANAGKSPEASASAEHNRAGLSLNKLDKHLLAAFHRMYFPKRFYRAHFNVPKFWLGVWFNGSTVFEFPGEVYAIDQLAEYPFPDDDLEVDDMLFRYLYSLIFGKKYFGSGFGHLSLITGFHHMILAYALIRLHARGMAKARKAPKVSLIDVVSTLKHIETQMGEIMLGPYAASTLELLLQYPSRARRILAIQ
ncbi:MAG: YkgJ family cysteine cluster protein [Candidatus Obscuribacterales bacterium]|nr:YkgJ family cysteine cluster protein [Candidatus Obscuribacterales bacterium]